MNSKKLMTKAAVFLIGVTTIAKVAFYETEMPLLYHSLRGSIKQSLYIPASLDSSAQRRLSVDLGGGACEWQPPEYEIPNNIDFFKTLIAGFPSCDKRMTFIQMEALTGWAAVDEWDLLQGYSNHPFIKSNYPHHEGIWSWGSQADQVVMVVRNIRRTMVEYHDILWDIATAKNSGVSDVEVLYKYAPPISSFFTWRDARVMDEIAWYGWFIDYWMEGGLQRDIYNHKLTTPEAWPLAPGGRKDPPSPPPTPVIVEPDNTQDNANRLVELLVEHRGLIQIEYNDVTSGLRRLEERDFLGPDERSRMYNMEGRRPDEGNQAKDLEYFMALEQKMADVKRSEWQALYSAKGGSE